MSSPPLFAETYGELDSSLLAAFQDETGIRMPEAYCAFLAATNGGRPARCWFQVPGWPGRQSCLDELFGIHSSNYNSIVAWYHELQDRLPDGFVPIGVDLGGNFLCLGTTGTDVGKIYYWDASPDWGLPPDGPTMFVVGDSIHQFLRGLQENPTA